VVPDPPNPAPAGGKPVCGAPRVGGTVTGMTFDNTGLTMGGFAKFLSYMLGKSVVDKTGLDGPFGTFISNICART
jgi:uncharacterized protein (TIGR03435 family)